MIGRLGGPSFDGERRTEVVRSYPEIKNGKWVGGMSCMQALVLGDGGSIAPSCDEGQYPY